MVIQECIFSERLLYIFPSEVFFSCASGIFRESRKNQLDTVSASSWADRGRTPPSIEGEPHAKLHRLKPHADLLTLRDYVRAVEEYASRGLSLEEDRLKAFAGIVAVAETGPGQKAAQSFLLHGNPLRFFGTLLTWHHETRRRDHASNSQIAPSWSWASAGGRIRFLDNGEEYRKNQWFQYSYMSQMDILGLPVDRDLPLLPRLADERFRAILADRPWTDHLVKRQSDRDVGEKTEPSRQSPQLPTLHPVTVLFDALLAPLEDDQHSMRALDSDSDSRARLTGQWSMSRPRKSAKRPDTARQTFAIVAGYNHMYIMLLANGLETGTFVRAGLLRVSLYGNTSSTLGPIMSKGEAKWQYIRLT